MYCQMSNSVQFDNGKTRMLSPFFTFPLYKFHSSGRWFFGFVRPPLSRDYGLILDVASDGSVSI